MTTEHQENNHESYPPPPHTTQSRTDSLTLRGGRLRKTSRGVFAFAPALAATASALALGALLSFAPTNNALAGMCTQMPANSGTFMCSGPAGTDTGQVLIANNGNSLTVTSSDDFGFTTSSATSAISMSPSQSAVNLDATLTGTITNNHASGVGVNVNHQGSGTGTIRVHAISAGGIALNIVTTASTDSLDVTTGGSIMSSAARGIYANHRGSAALTITANGSVSGGGTNGDAIAAMTASTVTGMTINAAGAITAARDGIDADHDGSGTLDITAAAITATRDGIRAVSTTAASTMSITANGAVMAGAEGIDVVHDGTGALTIDANAAITSTGEEGIAVLTGSDTAGGINIDASGLVTSAAGKHGIYANHQGSGAVEITAAALMAGNAGINARNTTAGSTMTVTANGIIMATAEGIDATHSGTGALTINANAAITSTTEIGIDAVTGSMATGLTIMATGTITTTAVKDAIYVDHDGSGAVSVTAAAINSGGLGIVIATTADTTGVTVRTNGTVETADTGISANHQGTGTLDITTAAITAGASGISATAGGNTTGMTITANGDITSVSTGINAIAGAGSGAVVISLAGTVDSTRNTNPIAIGMRGGDSHRLILNAGASIASGDAVNSDKTTGNTLEFAAAAGETDSSFALPDLTNFTGFSVFEKTGDGVWTLTGAQPDDKAFTSATFTAGTLRLNAAEFRPGSSFSIPADATLEITGASTIHAPLTNAGTLEITGSSANATNATIMGDVTNSGTFDLDTATLTLGDNTFTNSGMLNIAGASTVTGGLNNSAGAISLALGDAVDATDELTVSGAFTAGGGVTLDVDLTGNTPAADELILNGSVNGTVTIRLRIASDANLDLTEDMEITDDDPRSVTLVSGTATASATFAKAATDACTTTSTGNSCDFTIDPDTGTLTTLQVGRAGAGDAQAAVVESYAASLADIAALSGLASRTANRHYANGNRRGFWAQIAAGQTDTTPSFSSTGSSRDTGITRARFGLDAPLPLADLPLENLAIGANFWLAQTDSDITSRNGKGNIETDAFGFAASATLEHSINSGSMYADAQLQHATFSSDLKAEGESVQSNHDATSWGAALELGYKLPPALHGISFTPQAQLTWSSIDFDAFTDAADERISLADGETLSARLGIAAERSLNLAGFGGAGGIGANAGSFRAALDVLLPLDGETAANLGDSRLFSDLQDPALSLTAGGIFPLNATTTLAADLATTQGDETETYRASLSARFAF